jgi:Lon protease-like protein
MAAFQSLDFDAAQFSGKVRLFPLPNLVLFPHVMQPLHIFEPRYRELLADALADDQLITMSLLMPGWEKDYDARPPIESVVCVARIAAHQQQASDRHNVLLLGLKRARIVRELPASRLYREAEVELVDDFYPSESAERSTMRQALVDRFRRSLPALTLPEQLEQILNANLPLGALTDLIGYSLDLDVNVKIRLLGESNVDRRAELLLATLTATSNSPNSTSRERFPPAFSSN